MGADQRVDCWKRVVWRLTEQQDALWKSLMKATARKQGSKDGRPVLPTLQQLACRHPTECRWQGGNQWAQYVKCLRCGLRLKHTPVRTKVLPASAASQSTTASSSGASGSETILKKKGAPRAKAPTQGYVREPPQSKVEEFNRALRPILKAQALQQEGLAQQRQMMAHMSDSIRQQQVQMTQLTGAMQQQQQQQQTFLTGLLSLLPAALQAAGGRPAASGDPPAGAPVPAAIQTPVPDDWHSFPQTVESFSLVGHHADSDGTNTSDEQMDLRNL